MVENKGIRWASRSRLSGPDTYLSAIDAVSMTLFGDEIRLGASMLHRARISRRCCCATATRVCKSAVYISQPADITFLVLKVFTIRTLTMGACDASIINCRMLSGVGMVNAVLGIRDATSADQLPPRNT